MKTLLATMAIAATTMFATMSHAFTVQQVAGDAESGTVLVQGIEDYDAVLATWNNGQCPARNWNCLLYTSPSPRDRTRSRMPSSS